MHVSYRPTRRMTSMDQIILIHHLILSMVHRNMRSKCYWLTDNKDDKDNILLNGKDMTQAIIPGKQPETSAMQEKPWKNIKGVEILLAYLFLLTYICLPPLAHSQHPNTSTQLASLNNMNQSSSPEHPLLPPVLPNEQSHRSNTSTPNLIPLQIRDPSWLPYQLKPRK